MKLPAILFSAFFFSVNLLGQNSNLTKQYDEFNTIIKEHESKGDYNKAFKVYQQFLELKLKEEKDNQSLIYLRHLELLKESNYGDREGLEELLYLEDLFRKIKPKDLPKKKMSKYIKICEKIAIDFTNKKNLDKAGKYFLYARGIGEHSDNTIIAAETYRPKNVDKNKFTDPEDAYDYIISKGKSKDIFNAFKEDKLLQQNTYDIMVKYDDSGGYLKRTQEIMSSAFVLINYQDDIKKKLKKNIPALDSFNQILSRTVDAQTAEHIIESSIQGFNSNILFEYSEIDQGFFANKLKDVFYANLSYITANHDKNPRLTELAFNQSLQVRSLILSSQTLLRARLKLSEKKEVKTLYAEWLKERVILSKQKGQNSFKVKSRCDSLERQLNRIIAINTKTTNDFTWKHIKQKLKKDEAAIEIVRFPFYNDKTAIYYAALIVRYDSNNPDLVILKNGVDLENKYYDQYLSSRYSSEENINIYNSYWSMIQKYLKGINKIYIANDGIYYQINLNSIATSKDNGENLLDILDISIVNSTRDILEPKTQKDSNKKKNAILIGNPKFELDNQEIKPETSSSFAYLSQSERQKLSRNWSPLFNTELEINEIESILKKNNFNVSSFKQATATEGNLKKSDNINILHIGSHGYFIEVNFAQKMQQLRESLKKTKDSEVKKKVDRMINYMSDTFNICDSDQSLNSGLALAGAKTYAFKNNWENFEDGFLTAYEITGLDFQNTDLVVLSACETGVGKVENTEGVNGLQRAFMVAGAENLIMTLWEVKDVIAREFMVTFYTNWLDNKMTKREAFRQTQYAIRKKYSKDMGLWGGFIMIGT